jgi:MOSC domain-containing protein YiiM
LKGYDVSEARLLEIYITARRRGQPERVDAVEAVAGHGLQGDHYFRRESAGNPSQEVTLIESESLAYLADTHGIRLQPGQSRRNLVTQGVALNQLVGKTFTVGNVVMRGVMLCDPCRHLEMLTVAGVLKGLLERGGLRAEIVKGGWLREGNMISEST